MEKWAIEGKAGNVPINLPFRLYYLAKAYSDSVGVARFELGELELLLKASRTALADARKVAIQGGLLGEGCNSRALHLPFGTSDRKRSSRRASRRARKCR